MRLLTTVIGWAAVGACAGALAVLLAPLVHGGRPLVVLSDSMAPALRTGDAVLVDQIAPHHARLGDIVTFRRPRGGEELISHRVVGVRAGDGVVSFITRGDANSEVERWSVPRDASIGRIDHVLPNLGRLAIATDKPRVRSTLTVAAAAVIAVVLLLQIWRQPPSSVPAPRRRARPRAITSLVAAPSPGPEPAPAGGDTTLIAVGDEPRTARAA